MRRILVALAGAIVIAAGGAVGLYLYAQHRVIRQVEAAFEEVVAGGGKAGHGKISFDPWTRTLAIADVTAESGSASGAEVKIASLTASGLGQPADGRFSADLIEASEVEIGFAITAGGAQMHYDYKMPKLSVRDCSGPAERLRPPIDASALDFYRLAIARFAGLTVAAVTIPRLLAKVETAAPAPIASEFAYSQIAIEGIKDGKIALARADKVALAYDRQISGKADSFAGAFDNLMVQDFDATAAAAAIDPQKSNDDSYYRLYRHVSTGAYDVTSRLGVRMRLEGITLDDIGLRPARLQLPAMLDVLSATAAPMGPTEARQRLEKLGNLYRGIHIGNAALNGLAIDTAEGRATLSAIHFNLDDGKSDVSFEGLDARTPQGPLKTGKFAIRSFDLAKLMRLAGQGSQSDRTLALFEIVQGGEVRNLVAPYRNSSKSVTVDTISADWGELVGPIPSKAHVIARLVTPIDKANTALAPLLAAGIDRLSLDLDLGAGWTEQSGTLVLAPATVELGNLLKASARIALAKVPRGVFSSDPVQAVKEAAQIEAASAELTLRDAGAVDLVVAQFARAQNASRDEARRAIVALIKAAGANIAAAGPDGAAAVEAVTRFVETPGQTLVLKLTPLGNVPALQLVELLRTDPAIALAQFRIEASTGL